MAIFGKRKDKERDRQAQAHAAQAHADAFAAAAAAPSSAATPPIGPGPPVFAARPRMHSDDALHASVPPHLHPHQPQPPPQPPPVSQPPYPPPHVAATPPHPPFAPALGHLPGPPQPPPPHQLQLQQQRPRPPQQYPWTRRPLSLLPASFFDPAQQATTLSPSPFPRYGLAANQVATPSGDIILFGGLVDGVVKNDLYIVNAEQVSQSVAPLPPATSAQAPPGGVSATLVQCVGQAPSARVGHACVLVNNVLLLWGGDTKVNPDDEHDQALYLLNLSNREWTRVVSADKSPKASPPGRYRHTISVVGNKVYIFGGQSEGQLFNDLWSFDLNSLKTGARWDRIVPNSEEPTARTGHTSVTYNDRIYIFGGTDSQYHYKDTWVYEVACNRWSEMSCIGFIPLPREGHAACLVGDNMYIFGGRGVDGQELGDLASLMISRNRWYMFSNMGPAPTPRSGHALSTYQDKVVVLGGESFTPNPLDDPAFVSVLHTGKIKYPEEPNLAPRKDASSPPPPPVGAGQGAVSAASVAQRAMSPTSAPPQVQQPTVRMVSQPAAQHHGRTDSPADQTRVASPPQVTASTSPTAPPVGHRGGRVRSPPAGQDLISAGSSSQSHSTTSALSGPVAGTVGKGPTGMGSATDYARTAAPTSGAPTDARSAPAAASLTTVTQPHDASASRVNGSVNDAPQTSSSAAQSEEHRQATPESSLVTKRDLESAHRRELWLTTALAAAMRRGFILPEALANSTDESADALSEIDHLDVGAGDSEKGKIIQTLLLLKSKLAQAQTTIAEQAAREMDIQAAAEQSRGAIIPEAAYYRAKLAAYEAGHEAETIKLGQQRLVELEARLDTELRDKTESDRHMSSLREQLTLEVQLRADADERVVEAHKRAAAAESAQMQVSADITALQRRAHAAEAALREQTEQVVMATSLLDRERAEHEQTRSALKDATDLSAAHGDNLLHLEAALASTTTRAGEHHRLYLQHRDLAQTNQEVVATLQAQLDQKNQETLAQNAQIADLEKLLTVAEAEAETHRLASSAGLTHLMQTREMVSERSGGAIPTKVKDQIRSLEEQAASLQDMHGSARAAADQAAEELDQAREANVVLEKQRSGLHAELNVARSQLAIALQELVRIKHTLAETQAGARDSQRAAEQAQIKLQLLRDHMRNEGVSLSAEEDEADVSSHVVSLQLQLERSIQTATECQAELGDAQVQVTSLKHQAAQMVDARELVEARTRSDVGERAVEQAHARYKDRLEQLESDYAAAVGYVKTAEKKVRQMRDELGRTRSEKDALSEQLLEPVLHGSDRSLAALQARLTELATTNRDVTRENLDLERRIAATIVEQKSLQDQCRHHVDATHEAETKLRALTCRASVLEHDLMQSRNDLQQTLELSQHLIRELAHSHPRKLAAGPQ